MHLQSFLLFAGFALALMMAGEVEANDPEFSYTTGGKVRAVAISANGEYIAAGSDDDKVYLFDIDSSTPLWDYATGDDVRSIAISSNGEYIAAGSNDYKVYLFDKDSSTPLQSYSTGHDVVSVAISADGKYIAAGSVDNKVYLFDKDSSTPLWSYNTGNWVWSVTISMDGEYIGAGSHRNVYLFDKDSSTPLWEYTTGSEVDSIAVSADGEYIVAGSADAKIRLFDKDNSAPLWSYETGGAVRSVAISADGKYISAGSSDEKVYLFDKDNSTPLWNYNTGTVYSVATSVDGEYIVAGCGWPSEVYLFDKDSNTPLWSYETSGAVRSVTISADGERIAGGSEDNNVYMFDKNMPPTAHIYYITPSSPKFDEQIYFSGSGSDSDGEVTAYEWKSSIDGGLSEEGNFSITGLDAGTHTISFRVQDNNGAWSEWDTAVLIVDSNMQPIARIDSITPSPTRFLNENVTFSGIGLDSDGTIVGYEWKSSRDGFLSNDQNFTTTGFSIGNHTISFRVQDNNGAWSGWDIAELISLPNAPPVGTIDSIEPSQAARGSTVFFDGTSSDDNGTVTAYLWESSIDGVLSTEEDFSISTLTLGYHIITFLVQDNNGVWSDSRDENRSGPGVLLWIYAVPVPFAGNDTTVKPGDTVLFSGQVTDEDGTIVKYGWDFDNNGVYDWSSSENSQTTHIYDKEGTYTAVLRATDNDGFTSTNSRIITVTKAGSGGGGDDDGGLPAPSLAASIAAVAVIALRRRH